MFSAKIKEVLQIIPQKIKERSGLNLFLNMPDSRLFNLVIDNEQEDGPFPYENREKNSIQNVLMAILKGSCYFLENHIHFGGDATNLIKSQSILTVDFIKNIHKVCKDNIKELRHVPGGQFITKEEHGYHMYQLSVEGLKDLCHFSKNYPEIIPSFYFNYREKPNLISDKVKVEARQIDLTLCRLRMQPIPSLHNQLGLLYAVKVNEGSSEKICNTIINNYHSSIEMAKDDNAIVSAIVDFIYDLEHLHPFDDVNLRTCIVLANILLMEHGFPPVVNRDPNYLDGCSKKEFFNFLKEGMLTTLAMIEHPEKEYFGFKPSTLSAEQLIQYEEIVEPIRDAKKEFECKLTHEHFQTVNNRVNALESFPKPEWIINQGQFDAEISKQFSEFAWTSDQNILKLPSLSSYSIFPNIKKPVISPPTVTENKKKKIRSSDDEDVIEIYSSAIQSIVDTSLTIIDSSQRDEEIFNGICDLGILTDPIIEGETLITIAKENDGVSPEVISRLVAKADADVKATKKNN